jgi:serine/threonine protein kinase
MTGETGSYLYMAGEVFRHEPYNSQADVYSLGMILYEMTTGMWPFQGMDPMTAAMRAATDNLRPPFPLVPRAHFTEEEIALMPQVQQLIERCWDPMPSCR